jgi:hypothetical protein
MMGRIIGAGNMLAGAGQLIKLIRRQTRLTQMASAETTSCPAHGTQTTTFVCQHIATSLCTGVAVGFFWSGEDPSQRPDAWCEACERRRDAAGGWTPEVQAFLGVKILCGVCYDGAKAMVFA